MASGSALFQRVRWEECLQTSQEVAGAHTSQLRDFDLSAGNKDQNPDAGARAIQLHPCKKPVQAKPQYNKADVLKAVLLSAYPPSLQSSVPICRRRKQRYLPGMIPGSFEQRSRD